MVRFAGMGSALAGGVLVLSSCAWRVVPAAPQSAAPARPAQAQQAIRFIPLMLSPLPDRARNGLSRGGAYSFLAPRGGVQKVAKRRTVRSRKRPACRLAPQ